MKKQNWDEIEYFSKGRSLGKNCLPGRTIRSDFRRELCRLTVRDKNDPLKSIAEVIKSIDRVIIHSENKVRYDSDIDECKTFLTELTDHALFRKFIEKNIQIFWDDEIARSLPELQIQLCSLINMAYEKGKPRQLKMQSINKKEAQWVLSVGEKFKEPVIVIDKIKDKKLSEIFNNDQRLNKAINEHCKKLQSEGALDFMTEGNTGSIVMEEPPYAEGYYAHFLEE